MNFQKPVTVSFSESEAGPPLPQSNLTYDMDEVLVVVKWEGSKVMEPTWEKVPESLGTSMPLYAIPPGV